MGQTTSGVYEFIFGGLIAERVDLLKFWAMLGFKPVSEGRIDAAVAGKLYGHESALTSIRLKHPGCDMHGTGYVRLQLWGHVRNDGLGSALPIITGSRWMGLYTHDLPQLHDSFSSQSSRERWDLWLSPQVNAALMHPPPPIDFYAPFVGLRELLVMGNRFRLAFIQRGGFDRPGFGTFDDSLPYKNTEGSHANIVQPANSFSSDFYKTAFDFETAPYGEPNDSGTEPPTIEALQLKDGETFHIERTRAADCPAGLLQIYASYMEGEDLRDLSRPGSANLCAYSMRVADLAKLAAVVDAADGASHGGIVADEFGADSLVFTAPDGYVWIAGAI